MKQRRWASVACAAVGCLAGCGGDSDGPRDAGRDVLGRDTVVVDASSDVSREVIDASRGEGAGGGDTSMSDVANVDSLVADVVPEPIPKVDPGVVLGAKAADCLSCAKARCPLPLAGCAEVTGTATDGPAKGTSRAGLCVETLACVVPHGCAADIDKSWSCYCEGLAIAPTLCYAAGPCKLAFERSMEATDPAVVVSSFSDTSKGGGWAMTLLQCLADNHCTSCLEGPPSEAGPVIDASPDARADVSGTGGAGGTGGTGGTGGDSGTGGTVDSGTTDVTAFDVDGAIDAADGPHDRLQELDQVDDADVPGDTSSGSESNDVAVD